MAMKEKKHPGGGVFGEPEVTEIHTNENSGDVRKKNGGRGNETVGGGVQRGLISKAKTLWKDFLRGTASGGHGKTAPSLRVESLFHANEEARRPPPLTDAGRGDVNLR